MKSACTLMYHPQSHFSSHIELEGDVFSNGLSRLDYIPTGVYGDFDAHRRRDPYDARYVHHVHLFPLPMIQFRSIYTIQPQ